MNTIHDEKALIISKQIGVIIVQDEGGINS